MPPINVILNKKILQVVEGYDPKSLVSFCSNWPGGLAIYSKEVCGALDEHQQAELWFVGMCEVHPESECIEIVKNTRDAWGGWDHGLSLPKKWWNTAILLTVTERKETWPCLLHLSFKNLTKKQHVELSALVCGLLSESYVTPEILGTLAEDDMNEEILYEIYRSGILTRRGLTCVKDTWSDALITLLGSETLVLSGECKIAELINLAFANKAPIWAVVELMKLFVFLQTKAKGWPGGITSIKPEDMHRYCPELGAVLRQCLYERAFEDPGAVVEDIAKFDKLDKVEKWCTPDDDGNDKQSRLHADMLNLLCGCRYDFDAYIGLLKAMRARIKFPQIQYVSHDNNVCAAALLEKTIAFQLLCLISECDWKLSLERLLLVAFELCLDPFLVTKKEEPPNDWCEQLMEILRGFCVRGFCVEKEALEGVEQLGLLPLQYFTCCCAKLVKPPSRQKQSRDDLESDICDKSASQENPESECPVCEARNLLKNTAMCSDMEHNDLPSKELVRAMSPARTASHEQGANVHPMQTYCVTHYPEDRDPDSD